MSDYAKGLSLLLVLTVILSSLLCFGAVFAQSGKPSPPQFIVSLIHATYNTSATHQVDNSSIEFKITNQPFTVSSAVNAIYYLVRVRIPTMGVWSELQSTATYHIQSNGTYTILNLPISSPNLLPPPLWNASSIDFQLQAQTGYYSEKYIQGQMPGAPLNTSGYWETSFNPAEKSDWSNTQTLSLIASDMVPEFPWLIIIPLFAIMLISAFLVRYRRSGKRIVIKKTKVT